MDFNVKLYIRKLNVNVILILNVMSACCGNEVFLSSVVSEVLRGQLEVFKRFVDFLGGSEASAVVLAVVSVFLVVVIGRLSGKLARSLQTV